MKVLVVDDHVLFREGLVSMLKTQPDLAVVGEAASVKEAIQKDRELKPGLILMDFGLPDGDGLEAAQAILAEHPTVKIVFLTISDEIEHLISAVRLGAKGYLLKDSSLSKLIAAIRSLEQEESAVSPRMVTRLLDEVARRPAWAEMTNQALAELTPREVEILKLLTRDASNQEIAGQLSVSTATVKNEVHRIFAKLDLHNRQEAARFARLNGLDPQHARLGRTAMG